MYYLLRQQNPIIIIASDITITRTEAGKKQAKRIPIPRKMADIATANRRIFMSHHSTFPLRQ